MPEPRRVPVVVLGPGQVGRAFLTQLVAARAVHAARLGLRLAVAAVADRGGAVVAERADGGELGDDAIGDIVTAKASGLDVAGLTARGPLSDLGFVTATDPATTVDPAAVPGLAAVTGCAAVPGRTLLDRVDAIVGLDSAARDPAATPILVDCTAADTTDVLVAARDRGWRIVLANKVPLTGSLEAFERLTRAGRGARWETTVAAALPVIAALQTLVDRGDRVRRITGTLSGTLGFIARKLSDGAALSAAVAEAGALGYLEPDPRVDLSGLDAARKALILARMLGRRLDIEDIAVEGLYPRDWDAMDRAAFMSRLPEIDAAWSARARDAERRGRTLRYVATIAGEGVRLGMSGLELADRMARVDATDSIVVFETDRFQSNPLVVSGRGGGPAVTASGVLGDVVSLAREGGSGV